MPFLHNFTFETEKTNDGLSDKEKATLAYHDIFDYPLTFTELLRWRGGRELKMNNLQFTINQKSGFYFLEGKEGIILKRLLRERISARKFKIARKYGKILSLISTIKLVAISGALAMGNADEDSDIDFLLVTKKGTLWITRLTTLLLLAILGMPVRRFADKEPKDKICPNIWLDESNLVWRKKERNVYTAHEIVQIKPLLNREQTYEKFLSKNKWVKDFWPNAIKLDNELRTMNYGKTKKRIVHIASFILQLIEKLAFKLQYFYMRRKITREIVTPTRALFHPNDWGKIVLQRLNS
jgi:predicted nucleotidyltransferase